MFRQAWLGLAISCFLAGPASAVEIWTCALKGKGPGRVLIANDLELKWSRRMSPVSISDTVLKKNGISEMLGDVTADTSVRLSAAWRVSGLKNETRNWLRQQVSTMDVEYRVTLLRKSKQIRMQAQVIGGRPAGEPKIALGAGTCTVKG